MNVFMSYKKSVELCIPILEQPGTDVLVPVLRMNDNIVYAHAFRGVCVAIGNS